MKKIISLQALMLMGLAIGSTSFVQADTEVEVKTYTSKSSKKSNNMNSENIDTKIEKDKIFEESIKEELRSIRSDFDRHHNVTKAKARLKIADKKIEQFNRRINKDEKHKTAAAMHKHSLKAMSDHLHKHIAKYVREHSAE